MKNEEILNKLEEDMEMRGYSKYTKDSYRRKAKEAIGYFKGKGNRNSRIKKILIGIFNKREKIVRSKCKLL